MFARCTRGSSRTQASYAWSTSASSEDCSCWGSTISARRGSPCTVSRNRTEPRLAVLPAFALEDPWLPDRAGLSNPPLIVGDAHAGPLIARGIMMLSHEAIFSTIWCVVAVVHMWIGVARAGSSFAEELPIFLLSFLVPAAAAVVIKWQFF
jgi:hypothetical protein